MRTFIALGAVVAMLSPLSLLGQLKADNDPSTEREIRSLEAERRVALLKQDRAMLDRMYAADMSTIDNDGEIHSNVGKDAVNLNSPATRSVTAWDSDQMQVRVYGDVAIVTQRVHIVDQLKGKKRDVYGRLTHTWVKRDGKWQIVARHGSEIRAMPGSPQGPAEADRAAASPSCALLLSSDERVNATERASAASNNACAIKIALPIDGFVTWMSKQPLSVSRRRPR